jgi:hypothetical protein
VYVPPCVRAAVCTCRRVYVPPCTRSLHVVHGRMRRALVEGMKGMQASTDAVPTGSTYCPMRATAVW